MTKPYPNHDFLNGNYAPIRMECDLNDLVVEGEIPKEIGKLTKLIRLDLSNNLLTGKIPKEIGILTNLQY